MLRIILQTKGNKNEEVMNLLKKNVFQICFLIILLFFSCNPKEVNKEPIIPLTITVQPFGNLDNNVTNYVYYHIKQVYPNVKLNKNIPLPHQAFFKPRNRYKADSLLQFLSENVTNSEVIIGLTNNDISIKKDKIDDYGIMGLAKKPGNVCVASSFRLKQKKLKEQFFKIAIHEIGHTQGLKHCSIKYCFMRSAEGKNPTDDEKEFCSKCKTVLTKRGFLL
ncbi:MAG: matrixin family metalloprotease [Chitinophagaceae bacterium]